MNTMILQFSKQSDHDSFLSWLCAFASEHKIETNAMIRWLRFDGILCQWTLAPSSHYDAIFHAADAFNAKHVC